MQIGRDKILWFIILMLQGVLDRDIEKGIALDTMVDKRDGRQYEIVKVDSVWWFNENLAFETDHSDCFKDKDDNCEESGRLYSYADSDQVCPTDWRLPTKKEVDLLLDRISKSKINATVRLKANWENVNKLNSIGFKFQKTGFKNRKRYRSEDSMNLWLRDKEIGHHVHMYIEKKSKEMLIFRHVHEAGPNSVIKKKRKFGVRCVQME